MTALVWGDGRFEGGGIHAEGVRLDIDNYWRSAAGNDPVPVASHVWEQ